MLSVFFLRWRNEQIAGGQQFGMHAFGRCLEQDLQDFYGFSGWGRTLLTHWCACTSVGRAFTSVSREIMSDCERLRVLGGLSGAGFAGLFRIFRMGEDLLTQMGSYERWTRVCERLREIMSVCKRLRVLGGLGGAGFAGLFGIFRMAGPADTGALVRAFDERCTREHERLRAFTSVHER